MRNSNKQLLLIFTRNPELGKCKTRLAATIGAHAALDIYKFLLQHTAKITGELPLDKWVAYSENIKEVDIWNSTRYTKILQEGSDLGERMKEAFRLGFAQGYEQIVIIGSDMHDLSSAEILDAFDALNKHDVVIGPALDGGYYLLGMKQLLPQLFQDKAWGTSTVLHATLRDVKHLKIKELKAKNDVDVYEDIAGTEVFQPFLKHMKNDA